MLTVTLGQNKSIATQSREVVRLRSLPAMLLHSRKFGTENGDRYRGGVRLRKGSDREVLLYSLWSK